MAPMRGGGVRGEVRIVVGLWHLSKRVKLS